MGISNYAQYADVVEGYFVKKHAIDEYDNLIQYLDENCSDMDEFACMKISEEYICCVDEEECEKLWKALQDKFKKKTGLELFINHHDADDEGDEVDGHFFCVGKVYCYTKAGEKYQDDIIRKIWTVFS